MGCGIKSELSVTTCRPGGCDADSVHSPTPSLGADSLVEGEQNGKTGSAVITPAAAF